MSGLKFRPLKAEEIECRVARLLSNNTKCALLLYKDARVDMHLLDEVVGVMNWQRRHYETNGNLFCEVSIYDAEKGAWVAKSDAGMASDQQAEKGHASDSFKRACFNWGIGRELYTAPFICVDLGQDEIMRVDQKVRLSPRVKFKVKMIESENGEIVKLQIIDQNNKLRYEKGRNIKLSPTQKEKEDERVNDLDRELWKKLAKEDVEIIKQALEMNGFKNSAQVLRKDNELIKTTIQRLTSEKELIGAFSK